MLTQPDKSSASFFILWKSNVLRWLQHLIFSDIYITLGAVSFAFVNASLLGLDISSLVPLFIIVACATMFIYQFSRWTFFQKLYTEESMDSLYYWMKDHPWSVKVFMAISVACGAATVFFVQVETIGVLMVLGLVSFLYNLNIPIGKGKKFTLRKFSFAKIFMIAFVWASMSVLLPWVELRGLVFSLEVFTLFFIQFLYIFIITLPFDINDITVDAIEGVKTIPLEIGVGNAKSLLTVLTYVYLGLLMGWLYLFHPQLKSLYLFYIGIFILLLALLYKTRNRSIRAEKWQIMLWYDGSLILYSLIFWVSQKVFEWGMRFI